ncbi:vWA domain-containing protein [Thalassoroseus pseudoceratinae]|uniref:vWA domain-containing protein n=1 Tax=Thalassoroseus pseudoceratinae TaxID=2713176 RepID=UPI001423B8CB|nr:VWA domain-containing protein [Thalassoroseus pseudoceratinae]
MSDFFTNFHFIRPGWLLLIPVVAGLWWIWQRRVDPLRGWRKQMAPELLDALTIGRNIKTRHSTIGLLIGWIVGAVAVAGPTWKLEPNPFAEDAQPLMILLKASESMKLPPPTPSRLERAQLKIAELVKKRTGQPLGLIAYAGSAHLVLPPTRDTEVVAQMAAEIQPEIMPVPGDRLDIALEKAGKLFKADSNGGAVLVLADSVDLAAQAVTDAHRKAGNFPVQFLSLTGEDSPEDKTIRVVATAMNASVQVLTGDDEDLEAITKFAERKSAASLAGESTRWQEAGYWLTPILALMVAYSFRRRSFANRETQL